MCHWFSVELVTSLSGLLQESDIKWASRWDTYLVMNDDQIHWFSIVNSLMIVLFLSGMIAMIMMRTFPTTISWKPKMGLRKKQDGNLSMRMSLGSNQLWFTLCLCWYRCPDLFNDACDNDI
ncbi:hypothetical protein V6N11_072709 [Hibiscus sabdariffa]|uniref:Transmembrane 9 superfamily member n=1 Tax=Hibiscus sabdariffa TaxID=183260 RepID=A0ABR1ZBA7_9ROSI